METTSEEFLGKNALDLKRSTADAVIEHVGPIREEIRRLRADPVHVNQIMMKGGEKARELAEANWQEIVATVGLPPII